MSSGGRHIETLNGSVSARNASFRRGGAVLCFQKKSRTHLLLQNAFQLCGGGGEGQARRTTAAGRVLPAPRCAVRQRAEDVVELRIEGCAVAFGGSVPCCTNEKCLFESTTMYISQLDEICLFVHSKLLISFNFFNKRGL